MIKASEVERLIVMGIPDAEVSALDMTGTADHYEIQVKSKIFAGKSLIEQHRLVFATLEEELKDRLHAVKIKTVIL